MVFFSPTYHSIGLITMLLLHGSSPHFFFFICIICKSQSCFPVIPEQCACVRTGKCQAWKGNLMRVHELEFSNFGWRLVHVNIALPPSSWIIGHKCYLTLLKSDTLHTSEHSWTFLAGINLLCNSATHSWPDPCSSDFSAVFCQCKKQRGRTRSVC